MNLLRWLPPLQALCHMHSHALTGMFEVVSWRLVFRLMLLSDRNEGRESLDSPGIWGISLEREVHESSHQRVNILKTRVNSLRLYSLNIF